MLPWALISTRSDAAARFRAVQTSWTFRRCERARVASPDPNVVGKAKCFGFVWLLASHARRLPEGGRLPVPARRQSEDCRGFRSRPIASPKGAKGIGRVWLRRIPKEAPRPHPVEPRRVQGMPMARPRREDPPRQPRGTRRRSVSDESHRIPGGSFLRFSAHPEGLRRWFELVLSSLARSPAHLWRACSPPTSDARRRGHPRATRAHVPKDAASNTSLGPPKESQRKGEPFGHPKVIR